MTLPTSSKLLTSIPVSSLTSLIAASTPVSPFSIFPPGISIYPMFSSLYCMH